MAMVRSTVTIAIVGLLASAGASNAQDSLFTAEWAGIWEITEIETECATGEQLGITQRVVEIRDGDDIFTWDPTLTRGNAIVHIGGGDLTYSSVFSVVIIDCGKTTWSGYVLTRTGNTATGTKQINVVVRGDCSWFEAGCSDFAVTATRLPVSSDRRSWGGVKVLYD